MGKTKNVKWGITLVLALLLLWGMSLSAMAAFPSFSTGWIHSGDDTYYAPDGKNKVTGWQVIDEKTYYFEESGKMHTGWLEIKKYPNNPDHPFEPKDPEDPDEPFEVLRYYFHSKGDMCIGFLQFEENWYFFNEEGLMQTGWVNYEEKWYYFAENGVMVYKWQKIGGKWYYFDPDGAMHLAWLEDDKKWYYFSEKGVMQVGWVEVEEKWYYFDKNGVMVYSWQKINDKWYYFNKKGDMRIGWLEEKKKWYYFNEKGVMQTTWTKVEEDWYFFNKKGVMQTGWLKDNGKWYYLNDNGAMRTRWLSYKGKWYYFNGDGAMAIGWKKIKGERYYFREDGTLVMSETRTIGKKNYTFDARGVLLPVDPKPLKTEYHYDSNGLVCGYGLYYVENGKYTKSYTSGSKANLLSAGTIRRDYTYSGKRIKKEDLTIRVRNGNGEKAGPGGTHYEVYGSISYTYDKNGRVTEEKTEVNGLGSLYNKKVENTYNGNGVLTKQVITTDAGKTTYEYEIDENNGWVKEKTNGSQTGFREYKYDADGNPLVIYEVRGSKVTKAAFQYRSDGTLKKVSYYNGTKSGSYKEPDPDNPDSSANSLEFYYNKKDGYTFTGSAFKVLGYNEEDLLATETEGKKTVTYTYDEDGDPLTVITTETDKKEEKIIAKDEYTYQ